MISQKAIPDTKKWSGRWRWVYKPPRALYTKSTPTFIYFVVRGKLEEKGVEIKNEPIPK